MTPLNNAILIELSPELKESKLYNMRVTETNMAHLKLFLENKYKKQFVCFCDLGNNYEGNWHITHVILQDWPLK